MPKVIPFTPLPDQTFKTTVDKESIRMRIFWNANCESWFTDIEGISFDLLVKGLRLCTNILTLEGLAIREIGDFVVVDLEEKEQDPDYDNMGSRWVLLYYTKEELGYDII